MSAEAVRERAIDAMARAYYEWATMNEGEESRWDEPGPHQQFARARAEVMFDAVLASDDVLEAKGLREVLLAGETNGQRCWLSGPPLPVAWVFPSLVPNKEGEDA